jgi:hypothetical protein
MDIKNLIQDLATGLNQFKLTPSNPKVLVGFDGYVDRIQKVVQKKIADRNQYFSYIDHFSKHISSLAGRSGQIELSLQETKIGGNAPIMSQALASLGIESCCMGTLGMPQIHPVFQTLFSIVELVSIAPPAQTDAFEFEDGKLIFSECSTFEQITWSYLKELIGFTNIKIKIEQSQLFAAVDWVNLPWCNSIWQGILEEIVKPAGQTDRHYLFDIADPSRKSADDIKEVLRIISQYKSYGIVTLGLNETEAREVFAALSGHRDQAYSESLELVGDYIFNNISVKHLLIHPVNCSMIFTAEQKIKVPGRVVSKPKILTGGGDNLNAGFCLGLLLNLPLELSMLAGMATSGAYVQNGCSPSIDDLLKYLGQWSDELENVN